MHVHTHIYIYIHHIETKNNSSNNLVLISINSYRSSVSRSSANNDRAFHFVY